MHSEIDKKYMKKAISLARKAQGYTSPNPLVGAVIVKNNKVISTGYHKKAGKEHAEAAALNKIKTNVSGATMYVNLEPCSHYGRTPPCADKIINSGYIKRVVIGIKDPNPLVSGKGIKKMIDSGIKVETGVLQEESIKLNEVFIKHIMTSVPFVTLKTAVTLDGKTASYTGNSRWITGEKSRKYVHKLRSYSDAVITGIGTVVKDNPELTVRNYKNKKNPVRVVMDSRGKISLKAKILDNQDTAKTIIACTEEIPDKKYQELKRMNIDVLICRSKASRVDIKDLLKRLSSLGITSVLLEAGGKLNASFLQDELVDKIDLFIAPKMIGGKKAPGFFSGEGFKLMEDSYRFTYMKVRRFGDDILLESYFKKNYDKYFLNNFK